MILYSKTNGAATIVDTPILISPRKNITTINPTQNNVTIIPSSKLNGMINSPIAENANSNSHKVTRLHLSFQYRNAIIKQDVIKSR